MSFNPAKDISLYQSLPREELGKKMAHSKEENTILASLLGYTSVAVAITIYDKIAPTERAKKAELCKAYSRVTGAAGSGSLEEATSFACTA